MFQLLILPRPQVVALDKLHARGILHRDIKPENILIDENGACVLADLGLVRFWDSRLPPPEMDYMFGGTDQYLAPEQWKEESYSHKVDIWQLACVMVELISRRRHCWTDELHIDMKRARPEEIKEAVHASLTCLILDDDAYALLKWVRAHGSDLPRRAECFHR